MFSSRTAAEFPNSFHFGGDRSDLVAVDAAAVDSCGVTLGSERWDGGAMSAYVCVCLFIVDEKKEIVCVCVTLILSIATR